MKVKQNKKVKPESRAQVGQFMLTIEEFDWLMNYPLDPPVPYNVRCYFADHFIVPIMAYCDVLECGHIDRPHCYPYVSIN